MPEPQSTSKWIACYFSQLVHVDPYHLLRNHGNSIYIIGNTDDGCYTEIVVDSSWIASLAEVFTIKKNLPYFILPPWHTIGLEEAKASYTLQMTYVQILAFCGLLIDPDSPSLGNINNIRLCAKFVGVHCSRNWTLRLAKNIELCESVIDIYSTPAASKPEAHPPLYLLEIAADFASNRSSFLQPNHVNVFDGIQELGILLPNNTLVQPESSELEGPEYDPWLFINSFFAASKTRPSGVWTGRYAFR
ncbi:hypothetical protein LY78DRAFT_672861 [Colletotrichum sublineola]|nr:hypothetical protein LY78DRAFT_672861 [Colletotrichum sublineola]